MVVTWWIVVFCAVCGIPKAHLYLLVCDSRLNLNYIFLFQFFQRNGGPYVISDADKLLVEVMLGSAKFPATVELGSPQPNTAVVSFTVHKSGDYRIAVMLAAKHITGSPFHKRFKAGPLDPSKTGKMLKN